MTLADQIEAQRQVIYTYVEIDGVEVQAHEIRISHGIEQSNGQAIIVLDSEPASLEGAEIYIDLGYNGEAARAFYGFATGVSWEWFPRGVAIQAHDLMSRLKYEYGGTERTYTSTTEGSVIQNLAEAMGLNSLDTSIQDSGYTVGVVNAVRFIQGQAFLPWIREIDTIAGYATFTRSDGVLYRRPMVIGSAAYTFTQGTNILDIKRNRSTEGIYNAVEVTGLTYEGLSVSVYQGTANADIPNPPGTVLLRFNSNYIETPAQGTAVALDLLDRHNFRPESYTLTVPGNPLIDVGTTINVTAGSVGLGGGTALYVTSREHVVNESQGFITTIQAKRVRV